MVRGTYTQVVNAVKARTAHHVAVPQLLVHATRVDCLVCARI